MSMRRFRGQGQAEEMRMTTRLRSGREAISICQTPAESLWRMSIMVHMEYACCHLHIYIERVRARGARERETETERDKERQRDRETETETETETSATR